MNPAARLFRIVYKTFYFVLYFLLLVLLLLSPADIIYQSIEKPPTEQFFVIVLAAAYLVTILIVSFVYSLRLWINRGNLAAIPRARIPIDKGDVSAAVRKMITRGLSRSAAIAFDARPRVLPPSLAAQPGLDHEQQHMNGSTPAEGNGGQNGAGNNRQKKRRVSILRLQNPSTDKSEVVVNLPPHKPVWGEIEHNGWGSPLSPDFPGLEYGTVISELPNLIEAKALTLAPEDTSPEVRFRHDENQSTPQGPKTPDPEAVALLQRGDLGMRDYLASLAQLGVLPPSQSATEFLVAYEQARFSTRPISARRFHELMHLFSDILRSMVPLDPGVLYADNHEEGDAPDHFSESRSHLGTDLGAVERESEMDIDDDRPAGTTASPSTFGSFSPPNGMGHQRLHGSWTTPRSSSPTISMRTDSSAGSSSSISANSSASQIRHHGRRRRKTGRHNSAWQYRTAPTTPKEWRTAGSPSAKSTARMRAAEAALAAAMTSQAGRALSSSTSPAASLGTPFSSSSRNSVSSFAQTRNPYPASQGSSGSLRSVASNGSVIVRHRER